MAMGWAGELSSAVMAPWDSPQAPQAPVYMSTSGPLHLQLEPPLPQVAHSFSFSFRITRCHLIKGCPLSSPQHAANPFRGQAFSALWSWSSVPLSIAFFTLDCNLAGGGVGAQIPRGRTVDGLQSGGSRVWGKGPEGYLWGL